MEKEMKKNVGSADKILRYIVGVGVIAAGIYFQSWWGLVGLVPIITATLGVCPAYLPLGVSTCKTEKK